MLLCEYLAGTDGRVLMGCTVFSPYICSCSSGDFTTACCLCPPPPFSAVAGSAYGTAKSAMGISELARTKPNLIMKSLIPVVMSGVLSIYGIILSIIISTNGKEDEE